MWVFHFNPCLPAVPGTYPDGLENTAETTNAYEYNCGHAVNIQNNF